MEDRSTKQGHPTTASHFRQAYKIKCLSCSSVCNAADCTTICETIRDFQELPTYWQGRVEGLDVKAFQWIRLQASRSLKNVGQKQLKFMVEALHSKI
jgi:hypothetical protein